jgi:eukaryotic-like serine/threonine-protein kinase
MSGALHVDPRLDADLLAIQRALADKYVVQRELGRGGMATVYLARDIARDRLVALKLLRAELTGSGDDRFLREIKILAKLQHPNIVSLHDSGILAIESGARLPFYTMPYVEGESLRERLNGDDKPTTAEGVRIMREIADALAAAHAAGVVHRDLKPENVLLSQGHAMVSDFGIAKAMSASASATTGSLTRTGVVLGTPAYMAPEQALGDSMQDHRVDLYSLGLIAYEVFAGAQPFGERTPQQMLVAHATVAPEPIRRRAPTLDPALCALVMRLLEKQPADRPTNAAEVVAALDAITGGTATRRGVSRRLVAASIGVAAVAIALFAAWLMSRAPAGRATDGVPTSVAVLPFENSTSDQQYLADGMSEEIANTLSKSGLRVSPRASAFAFRGRGAAIQEIGARLHVTHVIEGSVRQAGTRLRVNVQLINVASGNTDWSEQYQRDMRSVFDVQDDIARQVVAALRVTFATSPTALAAGAGTRSVEAYALYLKGRYFFERRTRQNLLAAEQQFKQAIAIDPSYSRAYAGLSDTYSLMGVSGFDRRAGIGQPARAAVAEAFRLDSNSAETNTSLGLVRLFYDWDWPGAQRALERAIALDARYAPAHVWHAYYYLAFNQLDSALSEAQRATALDPLSPIASAQVGRMLQLSGRHLEALASLNKTLALDSAFAITHARIATSSAALGRCDDALREITWLRAIANSFEGMNLGYVLGKCHRTVEARALAADLERRAAQLPFAAEVLVATYAGLGEKDKALVWLERAYAEHSGPLYKLRVEPAFASLRSEARFQAIVKRMDLK